MNIVPNFKVPRNCTTRTIIWSQTRFYYRGRFVVVCCSVNWFISLIVIGETDTKESTVEKSAEVNDKIILEQDYRIKHKANCPN